MKDSLKFVPPFFSLVLTNIKIPLYVCDYESVILYSFSPDGCGQDKINSFEFIVLNKIRNHLPT